MMRTGLESFIIPPILTETNPSLLSLVVSQPLPYALCTKKSQPAAIVTRQEQQEATTHCGSDFQNQIF